MNERLERENSELSKQAATMKLTIEKYEAVEQQLSDKEVSEQDGMKPQLTHN